MDYFEILGIPRGANEQEIRKAYHKLAMKWHPDKNKSNIEEANIKFQEISEAYDVLSDPEKRAIFEQYGYDALRNGVVDHNGEPKDGYNFNDRAAEDIFRNFFGTNNPFQDFGFGDTLPFATTLRKKQNEKTEPIHYVLELTLEEIYVGCTKKIMIQRNRFKDNNSNSLLELEDKVLLIKIKPGTNDGKTIIFEKEGNESKTNGTGDIIVTIKTKKHDFFSREGNNLLYHSNIKLSEALADCSIEIPTLDGRKLSIPCNEIISPSSIKIIKNEGMPIPIEDLNNDIVSPNKTNVSNGLKGELKITFNIKFPRYLTDLQKKAIVKILT